MLSLVKAKGNKSNHLFRQVARDTTGETYNPPEESEVVFAYEYILETGKKVLIGAASYTIALPTQTDPNEENYNHFLSFLFIKGHWQGLGYGKWLLNFIESDMMKTVRRPIHVESAIGSVEFFIKQGYTYSGRYTDCVCSGSPLFKTLCYMTKEPIITFCNNLNI
ncbi:unnamed protein product [Owenia fusiformis]|uniref:Uncharacterized protein n=1 Tax=Owenia fusiformis TaxID=6347 RepID=A0A8J1UUR7_OWEFU|nr:unnamed protein product [Owenia fusiformis]